MRQIDRPEKGTSIALFDAAVQLLLLLPWGQDAEVKDGRQRWKDGMDGCHDAANNDQCAGRRCAARHGGYKLEAICPLGHLSGHLFHVSAARQGKATQSNADQSAGKANQSLEGP